MSHLVDWRSKIQKAGTDGEIGHDVTFKVIESGVFSNEKELGTEARVGAHKFVLCLVRCLDLFQSFMFRTHLVTLRIIFHKLSINFQRGIHQNVQWKSFGGSHSDN